jgi:hypothetical protein
MDNESSEYFIIDNCDVISNYMSGVTINECSYNYGIIRDCYLSDNCLAGNWRLRLYDSHPGVISIAHCRYANTLVEECTTYQNFGETYIVWTTDYASQSHSGHVTIQDNYDLGEGLVYFDGVENIIFRRNMILGGNWQGSETDGVRFQRSAIFISNEDYPNGTRKSDVTRDIYVYNNLIGSCHSAIVLGSETDNDTFRNIHVFNNTMIGNYRAWRNNNPATTFINSLFRNNAIYYPHGTVYDSNPPNEAGEPGWVVTHNGGNGPSFGGNWVSANSGWVDPYDSDWQTIDEEEILEILPNDFDIESDSELIDSGTTLDLDVPNQDECAFDFFDEERPQGSGWDIGAIEYTDNTN